MVLFKKKKKKTAEELALEKEQAELKKVGIQDEFQARGFELVHWVEDNRRLVLGGLAAIVLICTGWVGYVLIKRSSNSSASNELMSAWSLLEAKDADRSKALAAFLEVDKKFSGSDPAAVALLYAGHLALELQKPDEALNHYGKFVKQTSPRDELRVLGLMGLAFAHEAKGNAKEALVAFEEVAKAKADVAEDVALWGVARLAKQTGANDKARQAASTLVKQYPNSTLVANARILLSQTPSTN